MRAPKPMTLAFVGGLFTAQCAGASGPPATQAPVPFATGGPCTLVADGPVQAFTSTPIHGAGFAPDSDLQFRVDNLDKGTTFTFNAPGTVHNDAFHSGADGTFATNFKADPNDVGTERWTASDGACGVSLDVAVAPH